jgi:hypothetical protein
MLPFAVLPLAPVLDAFKKRHALAIGLAILIVLSVGVQLLGVVVDFNLYLNEIYDKLGLYHPDTLFNPAYSSLLRQIAYVSLENLDIAWGQDGVLNWPVLLKGIFLVLVSGLALWTARRNRPYFWLRWGLLFLLLLGSVFSLLNYAPTGDVAEAAVLLTRMEHPDEAVALTDLLLTEAWQDAYDGKLWVWGVPSKEQVNVGQKATWVIGAGDPEPAPARFQVGSVQLDYYLPPGEQFEMTLLPAVQTQEQARLGENVELAAILIEKRAVQQGDTVGLRVFWRTLAPIDTSYTLFVQLVDQDGVKAAQIDHLPCNGVCPTTTWRAGDIVGVYYEMPVRADAPPGLYRLITGMYDLETGETLPAQDGQPYLTLDSIQVGP